MNLLMSVLATPVVVLVTAPGLANAALPPGYEENTYCPVDTCSIVTWTQVPHSWVGGRGLWNFCYDPGTDETTEAMFDGSETKGDTSKLGWVEPAPCTAAQYSECDMDDDCGLEKVPIGEECGCYVTSHFHPFLQPYVPHHKTSCNDGECDDLAPWCAEGANAGGTCQFGSASTPSPSKFPNPNTENRAGGMCLSDGDCIVKQRSVGPLKRYRTGPKMCAFYATSSRFGFNEGENKGTVIRANCTAGACDGIEAICDIKPDDNGFGECVFATPPPKVGPAEVM
jgi:hypothetical protein